MNLLKLMKPEGVFRDASPVLDSIAPAIAAPSSPSMTPDPLPMPPGMSFPGGLEAMVNFVEQQIGNAERQLHNMTQSTELADFGVDNITQTRKSSSGLWKPQNVAGQPVVYGNTQTGYRADLRTGADVRSVMNCHQCKSNKKTGEIVFCGHVAIDAKGYSTTCTKRYCRTCLWNWYMEQAPKNDPENEPMWSIWRCPACRKLCCCHRCRTFQKIQRGMDITDLTEQAGALSPARCLARALSEAGFPDDESEEEGQTPKKGGLSKLKAPDLEPIPVMASDDSEIDFAPISDSELVSPKPQRKRKSSRKAKRTKRRSSRKKIQNHNKPGSSAAAKRRRKELKAG